MDDAGGGGVQDSESGCHVSGRRQGEREASGCYLAGNQTLVVEFRNGPASGTR